MLLNSNSLSPKRPGRLTGSSIAAVLELSPWTKRDAVLRRMVRTFFSYDPEHIKGPQLDYGHNNEPMAKIHFMRTTGLEVVDPANVVPYGFFEYGDFFGATPDGLVEDDAILEIKCPYYLRNGGEFKSITEQPHYECQLQMEMLATGRTKAYFAQYIPPREFEGAEMFIEVVNFDPEWFERNRPAFEQFYREYMYCIKHPKSDETKRHLAPLREEKSDIFATVLITEIDEIRERMKADKERESEIIKELVKISNGENADFGERKLTKVVRAGSIGYSKAVKDLLPDADLEKYRGASSEFWRFT